MNYESTRIRPCHPTHSPREIWFKLVSNISLISIGENADPEIVKALVKTLLDETK